MGCCSSCLKGSDGASKSTEMTATNGGNLGSGGKSMKISRSMTAPTIEIQEDLKTVTGYGLALAGVAIEQDAAYWEWHVSMPEGKSDEIMFGVATKKDRSFFRALKESEGDDSPETKGTSLMKPLSVTDKDTVGIAVQHSDLPMVQFLINGEPLHEHAVNRFRGQVYPSISLPTGEDTKGTKVTLVLDENKFREMSPHARFGPVIVAQSII